MNFPRISIVTPSYNQGRFIDLTMQSVLSQNYPNLEYIVIDGGSTDDSVEVIRRYDKSLAYWVSEKDSGAADAIAKGFRHATGDILAYLNSDDLYCPGTLHAVAAAFESGKPDVVYGNTWWIDTDGRRTGERRQTPFSPMGYLYGGFDLQQPAVFWTRKIYDRSGGIDPSYLFTFDTEMFVRFVNHGSRFKFVPQFFAEFRIHPRSKSSTETERCESELQRLRSVHLSYPFVSPRGSWARTWARAQRAFWYAIQGDGPWLLGRIPDRWRSRNSTEIAGPRSKWM
ncbi:MAG TPA: glycosyltransferase family 2 protein [Terriglobia bacterium]|nr:glycosyltransferase family 2 protein [Terriglobia bacterium]